MFNKTIGISILDCDLLNLQRELLGLKENGVTNIHLDVMDTTFVRNISIGPAIINRILEHDFVFDLHVMVGSPLEIIKQINLERLLLVVVHEEAKDKDEALGYLRERRVRTGIAINPETDVEKASFDGVDFVLIMAVVPGFGGQRLLRRCLPKMKRAREEGKVVGVDGGVNLENLEEVMEFDYVVVGSAYFKAPDRRRYLQDLREKFQTQCSAQRNK
jgi:ribulose-phosphate 3-epimerase